MKKLIAFLMVTVLIVVIAAGAAVWYVQPVKPLDLSYTKLSISDKILDMVKRRSPEVHLTEEDLGNLLKGALADHTDLPHQIKITGLGASQHDDKLTVDANLQWNHTIAAGATLVYRMSYREPNLIITRESVYVKGFTVPPGWLQTPKELQFNLNDQLPKLIGVHDVVFDPSGIRIVLKLFK